MFSQWNKKQGSELRLQKCKVLLEVKTEDMV